MSTMHQPLVAEIERLLHDGQEVPWAKILDHLLQAFGCALGTVHLLDPKTGQLQLCVHKGLPPPVLAIVQTIPIGKGMAGLAAQRKEPVQVCNLQNDDSGKAKPGAKLTKMEGSLAAPMLDGDRVVGVLGVAKPVVYEFTAAETAALLAVGRRLAEQLR